MIAGAKALLITGLFMHVFYETELVRVVAGGLVWLLILFTLTLCDYVTRGCHFLENEVKVSQKLVQLALS